MTVKQYMLDKIKNGTMHAALIDPDKQPAEKAAEMAKTMKEAGTDIIFVGGSSGITKENLSATAKAVKEATGLPVVLFGGTPDSLNKELDAVLFMQIVNATDPVFITFGQVAAAPIMAKLGLESISMGYVIVEPGMTVAKVTKAKVVKQDEIETAVAYAMACKMFGFDIIYFEAGSGADRPVPPAMIKAIKTYVDLPLIIGGGIRTPEAAAAAREAGADIIVTGTMLEKGASVEEIKAVISAAKGN
ncbi:MAG: geranylgeranylglyceryl/heptaprenylglyceryl phosphate synthase [Candidatus Methanomethylophilaceae archaeon]|nr:geranylgeranylglyceryl/heptaprenylglyceryl phosphate synthase [Candidatus Methanomethylophilaceae archaeon]